MLHIRMNFGQVIERREKEWATMNSAITMWMRGGPNPVGDSASDLLMQ